MYVSKWYTTLNIGAEYDLGSIGVEMNYSLEENKFKIGLSVLVGVGFWISID